MSFLKHLANPITLFAIASLFISYWGMFFFAPPFAKILFCLLLWYALMLFPFKLFLHNDFSKTSNRWLLLLSVLSLVSIIRTVVNDDADMYAIGNKWLTLFGNEYTALLLIPPFFCVLSTIPQNVLYVKKLTFFYLLIGAFFLIFGYFFLSFTVIFLAAFYPYVGKNYRRLIYVAVIEAVLAAFMGSNPTRAMLLYLFFGLIAYYLVYKYREIRITRMFCIACIISPFFYFIPLLYYNSDGETSFQEVQSYLVKQGTTQEMAQDTRTFLYEEMADDLEATNSWLWGKGAYAHYYSSYFDIDVSGRYGRMLSEVPFLNMLMHGGFAYVTVYFALILLAVYNGLWIGRNRFVQCCAVIAAGWYFNSFVCDINGARYYHIAFFMLVGCCLSRRWLNMSEQDVIQLFTQK